MIKSRVMRWAEHVASMGRTGMYISFWWKNEKEKCQEQYLDVGFRIILKGILEK
jgi:hypothetical protein